MSNQYLSAFNNLVIKFNDVKLLLFLKEMILRFTKEQVNLLRNNKKKFDAF